MIRIMTGKGGGGMGFVGPVFKQFLFIRPHTTDFIVKWMRMSISRFRDNLVKKKTPRVNKGTGHGHQV